MHGKKTYNGDGHLNSPFKTYNFFINDIVQLKRESELIFTMICLTLTRVSKSKGSENVFFKHEVQFPT